MSDTQEKLKMLNDLRLEEPDLKNIINKLKIESDSLDVFLNSLITIPSLKLATKKPLIFTMPVSGIVEKNSTGIEITAASQSLVTTPARGNVVFADEYKKLGKIIIINQISIHCIRKFFRFYSS